MGMVLKGGSFAACGLERDVSSVIDGWGYFLC